jgi:molybdopterin/thiamine biosynthesis adenylyltransferase
MDFTDNDLLRYSRQIMLPDFGIEAQETLCESSALIIGAGGLGCAASVYLAAAGIGTLLIADDDAVDLSNLQRQILHTEADIGTPKVESARARLTGVNPSVRITTIQERLEGERLEDRVQAVDLVIDGSDNFATRFAVNEACVKTATALVTGAAIRYEGQLTVFRPDRGDSPCYRCLYHDTVQEDQTCSENGVLAPVVGIIGSLQALEAIKVLTGVGETLCGKLLVFDGKHMEWRTISLRRDTACPVCSTRQAPRRN